MSSLRTVTAIFAAALIVIPASIGIVLTGQGDEVSTVSDALEAERPVSDEVADLLFAGPGEATEEAEKSYIDFMVNESPVPVAIGQMLPLQAGYQVAVSMSPNPPASQDIELQLQLVDADGQAVTGAQIDASFDMLYMFHGWTDLEFSESSDGLYEGTLSVSMWGSWAFQSFISVPGEESPLELYLVFYIWPQ